MHVAIDVGGTFTDIVVRHENGDIKGYKSPSTRPDITEGVFNGFRLIGQDHGLDLAGTLRRIRRIDFGTTVATNAILEEKTAKTGLITTKGFRDTLLIREGGKSDSYNISQPYPKPYVPRSLTFEVDERMTAEGTVHRELDEASVHAAIDALAREKVEAVAVATLWSIANPAHELRIAEILRERLPGIPVSLSHQVSPTIREYRRTIATVLDASLKPIVEMNVRRMLDRLAEHKFDGALSYITSAGGKAAPEDVIRKPVFLCFSGPSAAPAAGRTIAAQEGIADGNIVTVDMGGTSFDVSIVSNGELPMHREGSIAGHLFGVPSVEVHTIGSGGGSIARVDAGGFVHVGPESAGAYPGPACYGRGGTRPTVTDANLLCGFLKDTFAAGGGMTLSKDPARKAIEAGVAGKLNLDVASSAALVTFACEQDMVGAINDLTIKRGIDSREYVLVAGGAAAGVHSVSIARELGMKRVIFPRFGGVLSAYGILTGNISFGFARSHFASTDAFDAAAFRQVIEELTHEAIRFLDGMSVPEGQRRLNFSCEARYSGQVWQLTVPFDPAEVVSQGAPALASRFHAQHRALYAVAEEGAKVEVTEWNVHAVGVPERLDPPVVPAEPAGERVWRDTYFRETKSTVRTRVAGPDELETDLRYDGPLVIDERLTTIVVGPGSSVRRTKYGNYLVDLHYG